MIFLGSARDGPASLMPRTTVLLPRTAARSSLAATELRPLIPVSRIGMWMRHASRECRKKESSMGRGILLWLLGVPIPIIILILLFWN
jgi:hypothetical protein